MLCEARLCHHDEIHRKPHAIRRVEPQISRNPPPWRIGPEYISGFVFSLVHISMLTRATAAARNAPSLISTNVLWGGALHSCHWRELP